jgi:hypothetical protein
MIKSFVSKFYRPLLMVVALLILSASCSHKEDETYWDSVVLSTASNSVAFLLTSSIIPPAGDYGLPYMEKVANGEIAGLNKDKFFYMSMYPQVSDPLYNPFAENFLFRYDESGDETFDNYPAFVNNLKNFNYELDDFHADVISHQSGASAVRVGNLIRSKSGVLSMYVKLQYPNQFTGNHSVAVYLYEKEKVASQKTINSGEIANFVHKNVLFDFVTTQYGTPINGTFAAEHETEQFYSYDYGTRDINNLGVLTVVYKLDSDNKPIGVYTSYRN